MRHKTEDTMIHVEHVPEKFIIRHNMPLWGPGEVQQDTQEHAQNAADKLETTLWRQKTQCLCYLQARLATMTNSLRTELCYDTLAVFYGTRTVTVKVVLDDDRGWCFDIDGHLVKLGSSAQGNEWVACNAAHYMDRKF
jgi:hypothetical protein